MEMENNNGNEQRVSNWEKLKLLLWKNWLLQWSRKIQFVVVLLLPVVFCQLITLVRSLVEPMPINETRFAPVGISDLTLYYTHILSGNRIIKDDGTLNLPRHILLYSPSNKLYDRLMWKVIAKLSIFSFRGYKNAQELERELMLHNYLAGIEFPDETAHITEYPLKLRYALRFPSELRTAQTEFIQTWNTDRLYPPIDFSGPRNINNKDGGLPVGYIREGFLPLQHAIVSAYLEIAGNVTKLPQVLLKRFPYPSYIDDPILAAMQEMLPLIMLLSFLYPSTYITRCVTNEKEKQLKEIMKIMGLHNWLHWAAWFIKSFIVMLLIVLEITCILKLHIYQHVTVFTWTDGTVLFTFLLLYVVVSICFCFMLAVFFTKASIAAAATGIIWFLTYMPYSFSFFYYSRLSLFSKLVMCLSSNAALGFGFKMIMRYEGTGEGAQWSNLFVPIWADDMLTLGYVMLMLTLDMCIFILICWYVEQIHPGAYGLARKWYFPLEHIKSMRKSNVAHTDLDAAENAEGNKELMTSKRHSFEATAAAAAAATAKVGVKLVGLEKRYGQHVAVQNLTINLYENEITVLLGHNGAGKTTTILMLTGIIAPTKGTALINGFDIRTQLDAARQSLGICPQHNVIFDDMSIKNHIIFFSKLKGVRSKAALKSEIEKYARILELQYKLNVPASKLSGGMKRKLCLCCALCGNAKTVFFDEATSGVDPEARRRLWDLLQAEKFGRTILLTTHYMDEADVLGDRIAILHNGQLQCYGTSFYLKKLYSTGYRLICVKLEGCETAEVAQFLQNYVADIEIESDIGSELTFTISDEYAQQYAQIFAALEANLQHLKLSGFGVSVASMEEVFMRVGAEQHAAAARPNKANRLNESRESRESNELLFSDSDQMRERRKYKRYLQKWYALLLKRFLMTYRSRFLFFMQMLIAVIFLILLVLNSRAGNVKYELERLNIELHNYSKTVTVLETGKSEETGTLENRIRVEYIKFIEAIGAQHKLELTNGVRFEDYILNLPKENLPQVNKFYVAGATIEPNNIIVWLNNKPYHTAPLTLNILHNAMARAILGPNAEVHITNAPLPYSNDTLIRKLYNGSRLGAQVAANLCLSMCFVSAFYVIVPIKERQMRAKLLQIISGANICMYWMTHFLWDIMIFILLTLLALLTLWCFQEYGYATLLELSRYFSVLLLYGFAILPYTYLFSFCFDDTATGYSRLAIFNLLSGTALHTTFVALSFKAFQTEHIANTLVWFFRLFPHFCLANGLHRLHNNYNIRRGCQIEHIAKVPEQQRCKLFPICCSMPDYYDWQSPGILPELIYLVACSIFCTLVLLILESKMLRTFRSALQGFVHKKSAGLQQPTDDDVQQEIKSIEQLQPVERNELPLVVHDISKYYRQHLAVNKISFRVQCAECFGLLGVNGAGKTSIFKMLTGDTLISAGTAYVQGLCIKTQVQQIYTKIGYCPQFDANFKELTGREMIRIHCLLRGICNEHIDKICIQLAQTFGFRKHIDKLVNQYSGGNRRKLSTAIALIGNPLLMYLDEPTSGMDPASRRQVWNMVCQVRDVGKSIVLTSHSMEECEALCTRLTIMVNGEFRCMGSVQHLKNKFAKGLTLKIKVLNQMTKLETEQDEQLATGQEQEQEQKQLNVEVFEATENEVANDDEHDANDDVVDEQVARQLRAADQIKEFIKRKIPRALLQDEYQGLLTYNMPMDAIKISDLFALIEHNRQQLGIEDYIISQTSLDEIFIDFARAQQ